MSRSPKRTDDESGESSLVPRRSTERAQLRAALALEEAGELQEAARMFEYVGEHAQAASLRLEHAETLRDEHQRLSVLREGCARNPANSDQGQALHRALGEALLRVAEGLEPGARKRALVLEAGQALEAGQRGSEAGRLYEKLGLLGRAARAYTDAGEIERLEAVHRVLDGREQIERDLRTLEREVEGAVALGRRSLARATLRTYADESRRTNAPSRPGLAALASTLDRRRPRESKLGLVVRPIGDRPELSSRSGSRPEFVSVIGRERLRVGRAPHCELSIDGGALSREHAELAIVAGQLIVRDLGSRAGTFVDGQPLVVGEDWRIDAGTFEWALGIAASLSLHALASSTPLALVRLSAITDPPYQLADAWTLFLPRGGPLWTTPTRRWPATLEFVDGDIVMTADAETRVELDGEPLGLGARVDLLVGDRLRLETNSGLGFEIDVSG